MKVILVRDVAKIGRRNQIVEVPDGYAQNQLIPKKWALPATPQNLKRIESLNAGAAASKDAKAEAFLEAVEALKKIQLNIATEANEQGHLFKAVHATDVVLAARAASVQLEASSVVIAEQIKSLGAHEIELIHLDHKIPYIINIVKK